MVKILTVLALTACSGPDYRAPVDALAQPPSKKITYHTVARGETLYSIAWRYNLDVRSLARANGIAEPYLIYPGQQVNLDLRQNPPPKRDSPPVKTEQSAQVSGRSTSRPPSQPQPNPSETQRSELVWRWPVSGTILTGFSGAQALNKGIDIGAKKGEPVVAAESGTVVYAGNGLRGYGNLLIIKHNDSYLSAYAHNNKLMVAEGDLVRAGQQIAEVGSSGTNVDKLHFEIRHDGKPVDPLRYLPRR
ncbi:peptidoglycan DD-metalloendopeptidase family protein [Proteobacteria bacterium 005FR1]|nr:peptidoglycan DD-metalloendopeptidase family protein [Proteobacteria bacterium 005FR1]